MKNNCLILLLSVCLCFTACQQGNIDLDNSGEEPLIASIDGLVYNMPAGDYKNIDLSKGVHKIVIKNQENKVLEELTFEVRDGGLLNLAKGKYIVWTDLYGDPELRKTELKEDWIYINDQSYYGEFLELPQDQLYIEKDWHFGLNEDFPDDLLGWEISQEKWIKKKKLFREQQLVEAYNELVKNN